MAETVRVQDVRGDAGAVVVFTTDADGRVQSWSREAQQLFGYNAADIAGRPWVYCSRRRMAIPSPVRNLLRMPPSGTFDGRTEPSLSLVMQLSS